MEAKTVYFARPGQENTEETLRLAGARARELGLKTIVIASTRGEVALTAVDMLKGFRIIFVSHSTGFKEPNTNFFTEDKRKIVESKGATVLTASHILAGVSRAMRNKLNTVAIGDIVAETLRLLGQGMKVVCEISSMAADAGLVRTDEEIVVVAGTGKGSDTAVVLNPVHSQNFFDLRVKEIICKPRF